MKLALRITLAVIVLSLVCLAVQAQEEPVATSTIVSTPKWVSEKGFWVVESNVSNRTESIIYFYNNNQVQVYKEVVSDKQLNLKKRKTLMSLKKVLETAVFAFEQNKPVEETEKLFIAAIR